jgi:hypothetical protein
MTIVVPESMAAETFLAPFMAEDRREDDDDVLLILSQVFTMADEDGGKGAPIEWGVVQDRGIGKIKRRA